MLLLPQGALDGGIEQWTIIRIAFFVDIIRGLLFFFRSVFVNLSLHTFRQPFLSLFHPLFDVDDLFFPVFWRHAWHGLGGGGLHSSPAFRHALSREGQQRGCRSRRGILLSWEGGPLGISDPCRPQAYFSFRSTFIALNGRLYPKGANEERSR
ncbi:hypothetical protein GQ53DRAFT_21317 [Thozetella sp. PMI_491]|nr:hypothetical protein GQ53DRAFT_21317 [Thozetella sp. PMI_491]